MKRMLEILSAQPEHSQFNRWLCVAVCGVVIWLWILDVIGIFGRKK